MPFPSLCAVDSRIIFPHVAHWIAFSANSIVIVAAMASVFSKALCPLVIRCGNVFLVNKCDALILYDTKTVFKNAYYELRYICLMFDIYTIFRRVLWVVCKRAGNWRFLCLGLVSGHNKIYKWMLMIGLSQL